jgi:lipoic acid synthetase
LEKVLERPSWLKIKLPGGEEFTRVKSIVNANRVNTVCTKAKCPNKSECWGKGVFTFMILGEVCTRNCAFCSVISGNPKAIDVDEPYRISKVAKELNLEYVVLTSVDRDDLDDAGSGMFAKSVNELRGKNQKIKIEVLVPDFKGEKVFLDKVINSKPDIFVHNLETIKSLYPKIKPKSNYEISLNVLEYSKKRGMITKSGFMVGLGETFDDIFELMDDLVKVGCDILTIGQYMQPTKKQVTVKKYYTPEEFQDLKFQALQKGFNRVETGPFVRSSYHAEESFHKLKYNQSNK